MKEKSRRHNKARNSCGRYCEEKGPEKCRGGNSRRLGPPPLSAPKIKHLRIALHAPSYCGRELVLQYDASKGINMQRQVSKLMDDG